MQLEEYRRFLEKRLSAERFYHSQCVEEEAVRLAEIYSADTEKTRTAALLHDICKEMDNESQLKYLKSCDILLDNAVMDNSFAWHGITGSYFVQKELGVTDTEIINAIKHHTTARADMSDVEKIIFMADYTSKDRTYSNVDKIRGYLAKDIDYAVTKCLEHGLAGCLKTGRALVKESVKAYNFYLNIIKMEGVND